MPHDRIEGISPLLHFYGVDIFYAHTLAPHGILLVNSILESIIWVSSDQTL